jgi:Uma2 family endonuclease
MMDSFLVEEEQMLMLSEDEEDDEMPNFSHGRLQFGLLEQCNRVLRSDVRAYPPITFRGKSRRYTPDVVIYPKRTTPLTEENTIELTPPIIAVEIISPGQTMSEMVKKCREMLASGVEECWIIEAANETVTVCRPGIVFALHRGEGIQHPLLTQTIAVDEVFNV